MIHFKTFPPPQSYHTPKTLQLQGVAIWCQARHSHCFRFSIMGKHERHAAKYCSFFRVGLYLNVTNWRSTYSPAFSISYGYKYQHEVTWIRPWLSQKTPPRWISISGQCHMTWLRIQRASQIYLKLYRHQFQIDWSDD